MLRVISKKAVSYEYSSVQFDMPQTLAEKILAWGKRHISNQDLYTEEKKYGRENDIHVTVKYGLHTADTRKIVKLVEGFGPFKIRLGRISRFVPRDKDYDVVKIEVKGDGLHELHRILGDLPNSDEHPEYRPHCTIAYVKKGYCSELSGNLDLTGSTAEVNCLTFSSHTGEKEKINL